jgi:lipid A 4'-phosphatase
VEFICLTLPLLCILQIQFKKKPLLNFSRVRLAFLVIALIAGPGILVHQGFKDYFGRARPTETLVFGGPHDFTLPFVVSNAHSASFVSGHAAMGFYLVAYAFVVSRKQRNLFYAGGIAMGIFTGFCRVAQGRHFLSDVTFSGFTMLIFFHFLAWLMLKREHRSIDNPA